MASCKKSITFSILLLLIFFSLNAMNNKKIKLEDYTADFSNDRLVTMFAWDSKIGLAESIGYRIDVENLKLPQLKYLVSKGFNINEKPWPPLFSSIQGGKTECAKFFLEHKDIIIDIESENKQSPLYVAIDSLSKSTCTDHFEILKLIISHKNSNRLINKKNGQNEENALCLLITQIVKRLESNKSFYRDDKTFYDIFSKALTLLLEHGENPYLKDKNGKSAIDFANTNNCKKALSLADYMGYKYLEFTEQRKRRLVNLLSQGEKEDPNLIYGPFPKDIAGLIAEQRYKNK